MKLNSMKSKAKPQYWVPDSQTYNQLQKLKRFVDFVADAMNYKSYLTEGLNGIEVEIGIWNKVR